MRSTLRPGLILATAAVLISACASTGGSITPGGGTSTTGGGGGSTTTGGGTSTTGGGGSTTGGGTSGGGGSTTGGGTSGGGGGSTTGGGSGSSGGGGTSGGGGSGSGGGGGGGGTGGSGGGGTGSGGAQFNLVASADNASCNYIPNGALSGADLLSVDFYFLIIGGNPSDVPGGLSVTGSSDTGLSASYHTSPNNQALSVAQFALRPGDFGVLHTIRIVVDSAHQVTETDESDNTIVVSVQLPSPRPVATIDPLPCTVTRG